MKPWKRRPNRRSGSKKKSFNGATAMKPWKSQIWEGLPRNKPSCFNGATAMKPWKSDRPDPYGYFDRTLQWGHGDEAVEESDFTQIFPVPYTASMGPRR